MKHLGEDLDIHCGGIDNAFPHHTNEIAQSEAYLGHKWCKYWMHVLHLNTSSGKMSKSKGEFLTVSLLEEKGYDPLSYRLFCLQSHYRKSLVFTWENLDNAQGAYQKLIARIAALAPGGGAVDQAVFQEQKEKFRKALGNDLNTSLGVTALYDALKVKANDETKLALLADFDQVLSLDLLAKAAAKREADARARASASSDGGIVITGEGDEAVDALVLRRAQAKRAKDFAQADRIREELKAMGIEVVDTKEGPPGGGYDPGRGGQRPLERLWAPRPLFPLLSPLLHFPKNAVQWGEKQIKGRGAMDETQRNSNDFTQGSIASNILRLAVPLTVAQLTVVLYNVVDRAFIGHIEGIGRDAFTGIGLVMPVTYIITAFANLCGTGGAPLCSIARGRGDNQRASRVMGCSFALLLLLGAALTVFFYLFHEPSST